MSGSALLVCLAIVLAAPGPEELVAGLGSPRYSEREASAAALEKLGRAALPALRAHRQSADLEVRSRVVLLLDKIEGSLLLQPTAISLDFQDRPLTEVVAEINRRSGLDLVIAPDAAPAKLARRITLVAPEPLPFWTAIDRLCDASSVQYAFGNFGHPSPRLSAFVLSNGTVRPGGPMSDHGPFRVNLMSLHFQRDLNFSGPTAGQPAFNRGPAPASTTPGRQTQEQFYLRLQVASEPGLAINLAGVVKATAAVDERGQSMLLAPTAGLNPGASFTYFNYGAGASGAAQFQIPLRRPERPGKAIKLLRGTVPVQASMRKPDPLAIALGSAAGKIVRNDDVAVTVHEVKPTANGNPSMKQISVEFSVAFAPNRANLAPPGEEGMPMTRSDVGPLQVELVDAKGETVPWFVSGSSTMGDETRTTITVLPGPTGTAPTPTTLRYYTTTRTNTEIPFEFRDVPMP